MSSYTRRRKKVYSGIVQYAPKILVAWILLLGAENLEHRSLFAQTQALSGGKSLPFLTSYAPSDYNAQASNFDVVQDNRGVLYFGNSGGILEFDGASWRRIEMPNQSIVRSLDIDSKGRLWAGGQGDIGYLEADNLGRLQYTSILELIPQPFRQFDDVWNICSTSKGTYFRVLNSMFHFEDGRVDVLPAEIRFHRMFCVDDRLYVRQWGVGLMVMKEDSLVIVPGGEAFSEEPIYVMLPVGIDQILIGTRTQGLFFYDPSYENKTAAFADSGTSKSDIRSFTRFSTEADAFLLANPIYQPGAVLADQKMVLGTLGGGAVILDLQGRVIQYLDHTTGLPDNGVRYTYVDRETSLWLALENGITRVSAASPLSRYGEEAGIMNNVISVRRHDGRMVVGTSNGVHILDEESGQFELLQRVNEFGDLKTINGELLAATFSGLLHIDNDRTAIIRRSVSNDYIAFSLHSMRSDSSMIIVGLLTGAGIMRYSDGQWIDVGFVPGIRETVYSLAEDSSRNLWMGTATRGVLRVSISDGQQIHENPEIERFDNEKGLPEGGAAVFYLQDNIYAVFKNGVFRYDAKTSSFVSDPIFDALERAGAPREYVLKEDSRGRIWLCFGRGVALGVPDGKGSYKFETIPFQPFASSPTTDIFPEENGTVWFATPDGLIKYDREVTKNYNVDFKTLIRRVTTNGDSVLFGGTHSSTKRASSQLLPDQNTLRFDFAAPFFDQPYITEYQSRLTNFEAEYSEWSTNPSKEYTNLNPGTYTFNVRARKVYGHLSEESMFTFDVLPPWWRKWWAFTMYGMLVVMGVVVAARFQRKRLVARERLRAEREKARAIESTNNELQRALKHLTETQDQLVHTEKMASLGQLTAGIAHEIKNPLNFVNNFSTLSVGIVDELRAWIEEKGGMEDPDVRELVETLKMNAAKINEHGRRADGIIRSMLEHSRTGRGEQRAVDINKLVDEYANLAYHGVRAREEGFSVALDSSYDPAIGEIEVYPQEIGRVLINLLDNAFYAVHERAGKGEAGYVPRVRVKTVGEGDVIEVWVEDNGVGIPRFARDKIFEPFFTTKPTGSGTGLGLSLSHDIVVKGHGGELTVESEEGEGARFIVRLPAL